MIDFALARGNLTAALAWQRRLEEVAGWDDAPKVVESAEDRSR